MRRLICVGGTGVRSLAGIIAGLLCAPLVAMADDAPQRLRQAPGTVVVRLAAGADIDAVVQRSGVGRVAQRRTHGADFARRSLQRIGALTVARSGAARLAGRSYASVDSVPEAVAVAEALARLDERGRRLLRTHTLRLERNADVDAAVAALRAQPGVEGVEPNYLFTTTLVPNDARYGEQWSHQATDAEAAWDVASGDPSVVIAIIDSGVDYTHPDLAANIWRDGANAPGRDFVDIEPSDYTAAGYSLFPGEDYRNEDSDPSDRHGHGTHVAGIAAAVGNNALGVSGVCPRCRIMPLRAGFVMTDSAGTYGFLPNDAIVEAITYAANNGADVINMSFGSTVYSFATRDALDYASSLGVVLVAAAGNHNSDVRFNPAGSSDDVIAVASVGDEDRRAFYSAYGTWIDIAAPGGDANAGAAVLSTVPPGAALGDASGYRAYQGTSMAAPYVAGAAGLLLSHLPGLSPSEVRSVLTSTGDVPDSVEFIGVSRINVGRALAISGQPTAQAAVTWPRPDDGTFNAPRDVIGTATGSAFVVEISDDPYAASWTPIGAGGSVVDGVLGEIDPSTLIARRTYWLRLTVTDTFERRVTVPFYSGWRQNVGPQGDQYPWGSRPGSPRVVDLDGDGEREIIATSHGDELLPNNPTDFLHIWRADGTDYPGFPLELDRGTRWPWGRSPAIGDLDDDGDLEIVVGTSRGIRVFDHLGAPVAPWPLFSSKDLVHSPVLADLDGNGDLEIISPTSLNSSSPYSHQLGAWHHDGTPVAGFPVDADLTSGVAVGDLDRDGQLEIVSVGRREVDDPYVVYVFRANGTAYPGWPRPVVEQGGWNERVLEPVLADLDNDGDLEIVHDAGGHLHAWHDDGTPLPGWPPRTGAAYPPLSQGAQVVADLDRDGDLEVVYAGSEHLRAVHHDGTAVTGWPVPLAEGPFVVHMVIAVDLDGDAAAEVIVTGDDVIEAFHGDGTPVAGFPIAASRGEWTFFRNYDPVPSLTDFDGDGGLDLIAASDVNFIEVLPLPWPFVESRLVWSTYQHDLHGTGTLPPTCGNGIVGPGEQCDTSGESATCNRNCRHAVCGDGVHNATAGETCDGSDGAAQGCCTAGCDFAAVGTTCDDADTCSYDDVCAAGVCAGIVAPAPFCRQSLRPSGGIDIVNSSDDRRDRITWKWGSGEATSFAELGTPHLGTSYVVCAYDSATAPARQIWRTDLLGGALCGTRPCWKLLSSGYAYQNRDKTSARPQIKARLKFGIDGRAGIVLKGKGEGLDLPPLPLAPEVVVQIHNTTNQLCWSGSFLGDVTQNDGGRFKARAD